MPVSADQLYEWERLAHEALDMAYVQKMAKAILALVAEVHELDKWIDAVKEGQ